MGKGIYTYYKERLIEIGGNNKCLYLKNIVRRSAYDLGRIFEGRDDKVSDFVDFLRSNKKYPLSIISNTEKNAILQNLEIRARPAAAPKSTEGEIPSEELEKQIKRAEKILREAKNKAILQEIDKLKELKREIEEIEKETGRYELYIGYPFVFGTISQGFSKTVIKAPLMLFPVKIELPDENTVELSFNNEEKIRINPALVFAYAQAKRIDVSALELEFDDISSFSGVGDVIEYLHSAHIKINHLESKNVFAYSKQKEPLEKGELSVRYAAVLGRFPLSNSIYNDYTLLEKRKLTNDAVDELLRTKKAKKKRAKRSKRTERYSYVIKKLDYAQSEVVRKVDEKGNMVIYGPPGTGKSQTIVNVITDAICKKKRVLVVSQKKAALDVVYNRLGKLSDRAMYITDEAKEKRAFYKKCHTAHTAKLEAKPERLDELEAKYQEVHNKLKKEESTLESIYRLLSDKTPFGLSLSEMYSSSYMLSKNSSEYDIYTQLKENSLLMALNYEELREALFVIKSKNLEAMYYNFMQAKEKNPLIDHMQSEIDIHTLSDVKAELLEIQKSKKGFFNTAKFPYYRQVMAYYGELSLEENLDSIVMMEAKLKYKSFWRAKRAFPEIKTKFVDTIEAIDRFLKEYDCLNRVLTRDGYIAVVDNILRGNSSYVKLVYDALDNYIAQRDVTILIESLDENKILLLNFAYTTSRNYQNYLDIIDKILEIRIYHELIRYEEFSKDELAKMLDFPNITARISKLQDEELFLANEIAEKKNDTDYIDYYNSAKNNKDYLYVISKEKKFEPIRKSMEIYGDFILTLFPCWLLSPENVSNLLPLEKNIFDVVIFDEASQVFIESTIPSIYRGKNIVVAGDSKQLRPSTVFMKRYLGADPEDAEGDPALHAALEVDSLLDLAVARYDSANLACHYRSRFSELIEFSNHAFYDGNLQIAPNISKNLKSRPIERYLVHGKWVDRKNDEEAKKVVELLKEISKTRKNNESIGIITFNSEQQSCIADKIDSEMAKDKEFRSFIIKETRREEGGEDVSLFIKNLENVQGDERDIIIFSIGYAENEDGRIYTSFGSLSAEGGENRLNVAITRAKSKIIVVTSIEPEALRVDSSKNLGPKLLKKYLMYARAVSAGDDEEKNVILSDITSVDYTPSEPITKLVPVEIKMKEKLEKLGYKVDTSLGDRNSRISLAIYDEECDRYLVGVELDRDALLSSESTMERDVYKPKFLEARGWTVLRVWCRDWWLYPSKVIKTITQIADKNKAALKNEKPKKK
ncbi:MAG: DUF4011 domain-containing protein [Clostridia bacterium]|nr:DUF4011 domain-containing protein [Clostridia bacterium]